MPAYYPVFGPTLEEAMRRFVRSVTVVDGCNVYEWQLREADDGWFAGNVRTRPGPPICACGDDDCVVNTEARQLPQPTIGAFTAADLETSLVERVLERIDDADDRGLDELFTTTPQMRVIKWGWALLFGFVVPWALGFKLFTWATQ